MNQVGGLMFGAQVGQGLGGLAQEVVSRNRHRHSARPERRRGARARATSPRSAQGLERPADEVRLYLALREAAHQRLFAHVPWLRQRLLDAVDAYARGISVDLSAIESAMQGVDPMNPESVQDALAGGLFTPQTDPGAAGCAAPPGDPAGAGRGLGGRRRRGGGRRRGCPAPRRCVRRRGGAGRPAVRPSRPSPRWSGWSCGPRRLREAAALWWSVTEKRGVSGRDAIWSHPDLLPTADDLDDPLGFGERAPSTVTSPRRTT